MTFGNPTRTTDAYDAVSVLTNTHDIRTEHGKTSVPQYSARTHSTTSSSEQEGGDAQNATRRVITYSTQRVGTTNPPSTESTKNVRPALGSTDTVR